ncbi:MAG: GNAT family N-acetyltransferase [Nitriliruptorales bacterium]|nr:GNAT family N-acetyltransferase [Nitriliruptorales bacterium]
MITGVRWRRCREDEVEQVVRRLETWPCEVGGAVRHMFPLSAMVEGATTVRVAEDRDRWAAAVVMPGRILVPCGDGSVVAAAGIPSRRWRLMVGDAAAAEGVLEHTRRTPDLRVHVQRFLTVDPARVPDEGDVADPGVRLALVEDIPALARLAVTLHVDDGFGPDPGRSGLRGYARRFERTVRDRLIYCVGPVGEPIAKLERSVSSRRYGVQLAGIVVEPSHRGRGLGRALVAAAVRHAMAQMGVGRPISLHVRANNEPALRAYRGAGFVDREEWRLAVRS